MYISATNCQLLMGFSPMFIKWSLLLCYNYHAVYNDSTLCFGKVDFMSVLLARQPIFNRKHEVFGYELLYRNSEMNVYAGIDDNKSTAELINNAYLTMKLSDISAGKRSFINFSEELILKEIPLLLPKEQIIVEVLERVQPTADVIKACKNLKKQGYIIALDDFVFSNEYQSLVEIADIIKIEFNAVEIYKQKQLLDEYNNKRMFLAEKLETREEFEQAYSMGYHLFQGYFFSKPIMIVGKEELSFNHALLRLVNEMESEDFDFQKAALIIERDVGLSYQLLKLVNSISYGSLYEIYSIKQALARLGIKEIKKWIYLLMLQDIQCKEMSELINQSLIRARFMEQIAKVNGYPNKHLELFLLGLFSHLDKVMNKPMSDCIEDILIADEVRNALLGERNSLRELLDCVIEFEQGNWDKLEKGCKLLYENNVMVHYIEAIQWANEVNTIGVGLCQ